MSTSGIRNSKIGWTTEEQSYLDVICRKQKQKNWKNISKEINRIFYTKSRSAKQCRERFQNYIRFKGQAKQTQSWSPHQDQLLFKMYVEVGSKWAQISKEITGRSQNNIKNRFYGKLRRFVRVVNQARKNSGLKNRKPIKQQMIIKILSKPFINIPLESHGEFSGLIQQNFLEKLKYDLLVLILQYKAKAEESNLLDVLSRIHLFNLFTKSQNIKQNRLGKTNKRKTLPPFNKKIILNISDTRKRSECTAKELQQLKKSQNKSIENDRLPFQQDIKPLQIKLSNNFEQIGGSQIYIQNSLIYEKELQRQFSFLFSNNGLDQKYDYFEFN